jgi:hypothetical protein
MAGPSVIATDGIQSPERLMTDGTSEEQLGDGGDFDGDFSPEYRGICPDLFYFRAPAKHCKNTKSPYF